MPGDVAFTVVTPDIATLLSTARGSVHDSRHHGSTMFACPSQGCPRSADSDRKQFFKVLYKLKMHYQTVHGERKFQCPFCHRRFGNEVVFKHHQSQCNDQTHKCSCGKSYKSRNALLTHTRRKHGVFGNHVEVGKPRMTQTAAAINDHDKKMVNECSETQGNRISNYNFQTVDTPVSLSSGLLYNNSISNNNNNGNAKDDDGDCKISSFNDLGALSTSFMLSLPGLPTKSMDGSLSLPLLGSLPDPLTGSSNLPTGGSLPKAIADPLSLAAIGSLHTTNIISIEDNVGDIIDVNSCCICYVCSAMFRNNTELVEHLKTHLLKGEKRDLCAYSVVMSTDISTI